MTERIHLGHSLTRLEAARRAGIPTAELALRPDLLRIRSTWLEEVYFAFQFNEHGIRPGIADVVRSLHDRFDDLVIADWLARPNEELEGSTPIRWAMTGGDRARIMSAAARAGPVADDEVKPPAEQTTGEAAVATSGRKPQRHRRHPGAGRMPGVVRTRAGPTHAA